MEKAWKVGRGDKFRFWEDRWLESEALLMEKYSRLYQISCQQNQTIMQLRSNSSSGWEWSFNWRRPLFDSEVEMADSFIGEISQQQLHPQKEDMWIWKHDSSGHYSKKIKRRERVCIHVHLSLQLLDFFGHVHLQSDVNQNTKSKVV